MIPPEVETWQTDQRKLWYLREREGISQPSCVYIQKELYKKIRRFLLERSEKVPSSTPCFCSMLIFPEAK